MTGYGSSTSSAGKLRRLKLTTDHSLVPLLTVSLLYFTALSVNGSPLSRTLVNSSPLARTLVTSSPLSRTSTSQPLDDQNERFFSEVAENFKFPRIRKRESESRDPRMIMPKGSPMMQMPPAYYPLVMAEMIPGPVKTRHPSIVAVNGCPAYFIADHDGRCRQVFQYTVSFGRHHQRRPTSSLHHHGHFGHHPQSDFSKGFSRFFPAPNPPLHELPTLYSAPSPPPSNPRLVSLLRTAAKRFDLSFLNKQNSGETFDENDVDKLREKILSALKIKKPKDIKSEITTTTLDYDD